MRRNTAPGSNRSLVHARTCFTKAKSCFNNVSKLFQPTSEDYLLPIQYRGAERQLQRTKSHLNSLSTAMDTASSLSLSDQRSVIDKIALIVECIDDELLPFIEKEDMVPHQAIREELQSLELLLDEISVCLFAVEVSLPQKRTMKPRKRHSQAAPDSSDDTDAFDWRNLLINTIMKIHSLSGTYEGRTQLLNNISDKLKRDQSTARLDLGLIIDQLEKLGQLNSGKWPLLLLIENVLPFVEDFLEPKQNLKRVQKALEDCYEER